jgi:hypothetical protein
VALGDDFPQLIIEQARTNPSSGRQMILLARFTV